MPSRRGSSRSCAARSGEFFWMEIVNKCLFSGARESAGIYGIGRGAESRQRGKERLEGRGVEELVGEGLGFHR